MVSVGYRMDIFSSNKEDGSSYVCSIPGLYVELVLPIKYNDYRQSYESGTLRAVSSFFSNNSFFNVSSLKAPYGHISERDSVLWMLELFILSNVMKSSLVTVSPNKYNNKLIDKANAIRNISLLNGLNCGKVIAVESYESKARVMTISDVIDHKFPLALNVGYIREFDDVVRLSNKYHNNIPAVYLSSKTADVSRYRIDEACFKLVGDLVDKGWNGFVVLDYSPECRIFLEEDCLRLKEFLGEE